MLLLIGDSIFDVFDVCETTDIDLRTAAPDDMGGGGRSDLGVAGSGSAA